MAQQFNDRVILLTGAASGIGLATAHMLASRGATISIADANEDGLKQAEKEIKEKWPSAGVFSCVVDVRNEEQVKNWVEGTKKQYGKIDGAVNMAGVIGRCKFLVYGRVCGCLWEDWMCCGLSERKKGALPTFPVA